MTAHLNLTSWRIVVLIAAVATLLAALVVTATNPPTASADHQPICDEYPDLPACDHPTPPPPRPEFCERNPDHPRCQGEDVAPFGGGAGGGPSGDASAGELPFTGYPLTPLLLLLLILLATGLMIRAFLAVRDRLRAGGPPAV